jgi:hypothetical protein
MREEGETAREETQRRDLKREKEATQLEFEQGRWRRDGDWEGREEKPQNVLGLFREEEESAMAMVVLLVPSPRAKNRRMRSASLELGIQIQAEKGKQRGEKV